MAIFFGSIARCHCYRLACHSIVGIPAGHGLEVRLQVSDATQAGPYFFLSYAHTPRHDANDRYDPDQWVEKLFTDLCRHVMVLSGLDHGSKPGFMDRELHSGSYWPDRLAKGLATCRVFVPLYSKRYFESEQCGKEWTAFSERILYHRARGWEKAETIIPAIWVPVPPEELPEVARSIQFNHAGLGPRYIEHGFYGIMKLRQYRSAYDMAVYNLARRIVEVGESTRLAPTVPPDYDSLRSAFGASEPPWAGSHRIRITVIAPDIHNLPEGREPYHYGHTPQEWNPYRPEIGRPLAEHAVEVIRNLGFRADVGSIDDHYDHLFGDDPPTSAGLVLVDNWAAVSEKYQEPLRRLDQADKPWITVMVPINKGDAQTTEAEHRLQGHLGAILERKLTEGHPVKRSVANDISTFDQFCKAVPEMVRTAMNHFLQRAPTYPPEGRASMERPRLQGPQSPYNGNDAEAQP
ncbi:TIR-like protein FxsC [Sphaerisporangium dianthi]|uniref:TIR-like protein FxsC n=1 Tax=Sphaerisporangium dianthi TaxID=1436120 RepID=A0ABV9CFA3_9ACTN